ncbi:MAG TPA: DUF1761 domain-containing protein [Candidatus Saccharimonadia bacterium]|nr:DUF1761 domain-containing protein [Candidatus Saccharimonadia bacterium]
MVFGISFWWLILALAAYMVVGALWYSPLLFAKQWLQALGKKRSDMPGNDPALYLTPLFSTLVLVVVLASLVSSLGAVGWTAGALLGFKLWLGFVATTALINRVFQGGSMRLYIIDMGYHLVGFAVAGAILAH